MQLAAKSLGLGSQWVSATGGFMEDPLKKLLDIPKEFRLMISWQWAILPIQLVQVPKKD